MADEKPTHVSYKEYKKKLESNPNEGLILFVSAFFVMLLIFLGVVKQLSPDVDVTISDNQEEFVDERSSVDDRLKEIQMEDNSFGQTDEMFSPELEERVLLPKIKRKTVGEEEVATDEPKNVEEPKKVETPKPEAQKPEAPKPLMSAKVIVGYYTTAEQANVAKDIVQEAGFQPFVRNIGGAYTLQVGSFSSREKAQSVANDLLKSNFPARVIVD